MSASLLDWKEELKEDKKNHLFNALAQIYLSMVVLDFDCCTAVVLSSNYKEELVGIEMPWEALAERYALRVLGEVLDRLFSILTFGNLSLFCDGGMNEKSEEVRCQQVVGGISLYPQDGLVYEQLVRKADQARYRSKRYGKNNYSLYSEEMDKGKYFSALSEIISLK